MLTTSAEPSDQLHLGAKPSLCYSREALPGCDKNWDTIFGSVGLTGGCSTGISFEVGSTSLPSPPGDRKVFGWSGAHVLQSWSCSPPAQATSYSHRFPSHPHLSQSFRWRAALAKPALHFLSSYCHCGDGTPTSTPFTHIPLGQASQQNTQKCIFLYSGILKMCDFAMKQYDTRNYS